MPTSFGRRILHGKTYCEFTPEELEPLGVTLGDPSMWTLGTAVVRALPVANGWEIVIHTGDEFWLMVIECNPGPDGWVCHNDLMNGDEIDAVLVAPRNVMTTVFEVVKS